MKTLLLFALVFGLPWLPSAKGPSAGGVGGAQSFSDDFDRANSSSIGSDWTEINGDLEIISSQLTNVTANVWDAAVWNTATASGVQYAKFTINDFNAATKGWFAVLRYTDASSPFYIVGVDRNDTTIAWRRVASATFGTIDNIDATSQSFPSGDTLGIVITGTADATVVKFWMNPTAAAPTSDSLWDGNAPTGTMTGNPAAPVDSGNKVGVATFSGLGRGMDLNNWSSGNVP